MEEQQDAASVAGKGALAGGISRSGCALEDASGGSGPFVSGGGGPFVSEGLARPS
jgi:hypothetical protein